MRNTVDGVKTLRHGFRSNPHLEIWPGVLRSVASPFERRGKWDRWFRQVCPPPQRITILRPQKDGWDILCIWLGAML